MQEVLTVAAEAVTVFGLVWLAVGLVVQYPGWRRNGGSFEPPVLVEDDLPALGDLLEVAEAAALRPVPAVAQRVAVPVAVLTVEAPPITCTYAGLGVRELRRLGQQLRVPKARAATKGALLAALPTSRKALIAACEG